MAQFHPHPAPSGEVTQLRRRLITRENLTPSMRLQVQQTRPLLFHAPLARTVAQILFVLTCHWLLGQLQGKFWLPVASLWHHTVNAKAVLILPSVARASVCRNVPQTEEMMSRHVMRHVAWSRVRHVVWSRVRHVVWSRVHHVVWSRGVVTWCSHVVWSCVRHCVSVGCLSAQACRVSIHVSSRHIFMTSGCALFENRT